MTKKKKETALKNVMSFYGVTAKALEDMIGVSDRTIEKYMSGESPIQNAKAIRVQNIADALNGIDMHYLLEYPSHPIERYYAEDIRDQLSGLQKSLKPSRKKEECVEQSKQKLNELFESPDEVVSLLKTPKGAEYLKDWIVAVQTGKKPAAETINMNSIYLASSIAKSAYFYEASKPDSNLKLPSKDNSSTKKWAELLFKNSFSKQNQDYDWLNTGSDGFNALVEMLNCLKED